MQSIGSKRLRLIEPNLSYTYFMCRDYRAVQLKIIWHAARKYIAMESFFVWEIVSCSKRCIEY